MVQIFRAARNMAAAAALVTAGGCASTQFNSNGPASTAAIGYVTAETNENNAQPTWKINGGGSIAREGVDRNGKPVFLSFPPFVVRGDASGNEFRRLSHEIRDPMAAACGFKLLDHEPRAVTSATGTNVDPNVIGTRDFGQTTLKIEGNPYGAPTNQMYICGTKAAAAPKIAGTVIVHFDFDKATLREDDKLALRNAARIASEQGRIVAVDVAGHTDRAGTDQYNLLLGQRRADAVRAYLLGPDIQRDIRIDIEAGIKTRSLGESQPVDPNRPDGQPNQADRRAIINMTVDPQ